MNASLALTIAVLNLIVLIGLFVWLLIGSPSRMLRSLLSKDEQMAQQEQLKSQLTQANERLGDALSEMARDDE